MELIESKTLGTAQAIVEFTAIPQTFTDLVVLWSGRTTESSTWTNILLRFNSSTSDFTGRQLYGTGSAAASASSARFLGYDSAANATANTFGNSALYIPNYTGSTNKSFSVDSVSENNASGNLSALQVINAGLWSNSEAINAITIEPTTGNFVANSIFSLYGITKGSDGIVTTTP